MRGIIAVSILSIGLGLDWSPAAAAGSDAAKVLTGAAAFGSWEDSKPGVERRIQLSDLPKPYATKSASNAPGSIDKPAGAVPSVLPGFAVTEFAKGLSEPRVITVGPNGDIFVADSGAGEIRVFRMGTDGSVSEKGTFAAGLDQPYGIAFYPPGANPDHVYVANTGNVVRFPYKSGDMTAGGAAETIIPDLPTGGHWTRDLVFSPDGRTLYVSVGSASNVGEGTMRKRPPADFAAAHPLGEAWGEEEDRAAVLAFDPDGTNKRVVATGLRNCTGMALQPQTGALWCVVNERDGLGDNLPPDYATHVESGAFYGWPWYYLGPHEDPRHVGQRPDLAGKVTAPDVLFQAHSAPLGITFYEGKAFPAEYQGDAFVALHGSWNRNHRTGYKVVRLRFEGGKPTGVYQDFMTGFVSDAQNVWGRPVDVAVAQDGSLLVSDDGSGRIWRVAAKPAAAAN
jgi:glucose/arabinose dehydrogenase